DRRGTTEFVVGTLNHEQPRFLLKVKYTIEIESIPMVSGERVFRVGEEYRRLFGQLGRLNFNEPILAVFAPGPYIEAQAVALRLRHPFDLVRQRLLPRCDQSPPLEL